MSIEKAKIIGRFDPKTGGIKDAGRPYYTGEVVLLQGKDPVQWGVVSKYVRDQEGKPAPLIIFILQHMNACLMEVVN